MKFIERWFIEKNLKYLTEREREHYRKMLPVWCKDIKRVKCPEELVSVIQYRKSLKTDEKDEYQNKRRK